MKKSAFMIALGTAFACAVRPDRPRRSSRLRPWTTSRPARLEDYLAYDGNVTGKRPGVLLVYRRDGMTDFTHKHADLIAKLGYIIFAADIFGKGVLPKDIPELRVETAKYNKDRLLMRARKLGARILELPTMAMIEGVALTTTTTYVQEHEDEARSLIMALIDATHVFKTKKADTLAIIKKYCSELLKMQNDEEWDCFYETQAASLEAKPYPTLEAIKNVLALALKRDPEIKSFNPLALWDLHYLREIDDSGYINRLYA